MLLFLETKEEERKNHPRRDDLGKEKEINYRNLYKLVYTFVYMIKIRKMSIKKGSKDLKKSKAKKKTKRIELNSKELRINLEKLRKDVKDAYETMTKILPQAVKDAEIKRFGNASHIILPKEYAGKRAIVIV